MGLSSTTILVMVQAAVPWQRRAVATGLVQFSRTIGGAVGVGLARRNRDRGRGQRLGHHSGPDRAQLHSGGAAGCDAVGPLRRPRMGLRHAWPSTPRSVAAVAIRFMPAVRIERRASGAAGSSSGARATGGRATRPGPASAGYSRP